MLVSRILGIIGRTMIAAGVLILLFVAFQLWGTGLRTSAAQGRLTTELQAKLDKAQHADDPTLTASGTSSTTSPTLPAPDGTAAPTSSTAPTTPPTPAPGGLPPPQPGEVIGRIEIPRIGVDFAYVEAVDLEYLKDGPGHFPTTPFPGQEGNAALAGHRTTWQAPFNRIDELSPGDQVTITTVQGTFTYEVLPQPGANAGEVVGHHIVGPNAVEILKQEPNVNTLTLMACHPKYSADQRIVVVAKLVGNPAATTAKSDEAVASGLAPADQATQGLLGGEGQGILSNSPEDRGPAIVWGAVAAAVWLLAWFVARRWKGWRRWQHWAVYAVALPFFLVPLFLSFEHINHMLPAGY